VVEDGGPRAQGFDGRRRTSRGVNGRWNTGRTEAFSDGVFAIAITLLVLDIRVPGSAFRDLWAGIGEQWPAYLAYVTSFSTIGFVWLAHHAMFGRVRAVESTVMRINLLLLLVVSFLPFPTRLMAEAIHDKNAERAAVVFYGVTLLAISLAVGAMWRAVAARPQLLREDVDEADVEDLLRATAPNIGFYVIATLVAVAFPYLAAFGYLIIAVSLVLRARGDVAPQG
jgi:uncharacterized membrane protein